VIAVKISIFDKDVAAWKNMLEHIGDTRGWMDSRRNLVSTEFVTEELQKYKAEYDPIMVEVLFPEEKYYTMWQLRWG
jgi:hypothetical protein